MRNMLFAFLAVAGLAFTSPAHAQDDPAPEATEEAAEATEEDAPAADAPADEAAEGDEEPAEGDDAAEPAEDAEEAEEAAEGGEEAEAGEGEPKVPASDDEAVETALSLLDAVQNGQWPLAVGLFLTLLVYGVNRFALKDKVGEKVIPWIAGGVGFAGAVGTALVSGTPIADALVAGGIAAVAAIGGWEALLKHITAGKSEDKPAEEPKAEEPKADS